MQISILQFDLNANIYFVCFAEKSLYSDHTVEDYSSTNEDLDIDLDHTVEGNLT